MEPTSQKLNRNNKLDSSRKDLPAKRQRRLDAVKSYFGGITGVWHAFQECGYVGMTRKAVEKWYERHQMPDDKFKVIMMFIVQNGHSDKFFQHVAKIGIMPEDLLL